MAWESLRRRPAGSVRGRCNRPAAGVAWRLDLVLRMRLSLLQRAQAEVRVRLGAKLPTIEATQARSDLSSTARDRSVEIRRQLGALLTSSYL